MLPSIKANIARSRLSHAAHDAGDHTPHRQLLAVLQLDGGEGRILGDEAHAPAALPQALDREFAVDDCDDDVATCGFQRTVDHQQIAVGDAGAGHGVAFHTHEEGRLAVGDEVLVQVEGALDVVVGRRGKARRYAGEEQGAWHPPGVGGRDRDHGLILSNDHSMIRPVRGRCVSLCFSAGFMLWGGQHTGIGSAAGKVDVSKSAKAAGMRRNAGKSAVAQKPGLNNFRPVMGMGGRTYPQQEFTVEITSVFQALVVPSVQTHPSC